MRPRHSLPIDYAALGSRIFVPHETHLADARLVVGAEDDAARAWRALEDAPFATGARVGARCFGPPSICGACDEGNEREGRLAPNPFTGLTSRRARRRCPRCVQEPDFARLHTFPGTVSECIRYAADPEGMTSVEELAREVCARIVSGASPRTIIWRTSDPRTWRPSFGLEDLIDYDALPPSFYGFYASGDRLAAGLRDLHALLPQELLAEQYDRAFARVCPEVTSTSFVMDAEALPTDFPAAAAGLLCTVVANVTWETVAETRGRANPFDPALRIWECGYVLDAIGEDFVVLTAPLLG